MTTATGPLFVSLRGHLVRADCSCTECPRAHPYAVPTPSTTDREATP